MSWLLLWYFSTYASEQFYLGYNHWHAAVNVYLVILPSWVWARKKLVLKRKLEKPPENVLSFVIYISLLQHFSFSLSFKRLFFHYIFSTKKSFSRVVLLVLLRWYDLSNSSLGVVMHTTVNTIFFCIIISCFFANQTLFFF